MSARTPIALTIAGSELGRRRGVQADLRTFAALGVYGASAITALTAQNTLGVRAIHVVPPDVVRAQIDAVLDDFRRRGDQDRHAGAARRSSECGRAPPLLPRAREAFVVYDPVLAASSGDALAGAGFVAAVRTKLLPFVDCLTPNLPEAAALLGAAMRRAKPR